MENDNKIGTIYYNEEDDFYYVVWGNNTTGLMKLDSINEIAYQYSKPDVISDIYSELRNK